MSVLVVARWDARASLRDRWFLALALAFGILTLAASLTSLAGLRVVGLASFDRAAAALLYLAQLFVPLIGLTLGAGWLAGEREAGALEFLLAQPIPRGWLYTGRFWGLGVSTLGALWVGYGAAGTVLAWAAGTNRLGVFLALVGLCSLLALATLSVGLCISAFSSTRQKAVVAALLVWLGAVMLADLAVLATAVALRLPAGVTLILGALNPVSAFRMAGLLLITRSPELWGPLGLLAVDRLGYTGALAVLVGTLGAWTAAPWAVGAARFARVRRP